MALILNEDLLPAFIPAAWWLEVDRKARLKGLVRELSRV